MFLFEIISIVGTLTAIIALFLSIKSILIANRQFKFIKKEHEKSRNILKTQIKNVLFEMDQMYKKLSQHFDGIPNYKKPKITYSVEKTFSSGYPVENLGHLEKLKRKLFWLKWRTDKNFKEIQGNIYYKK